MTDDFNTHDDDDTPAHSFAPLPDHANQKILPPLIVLAALALAIALEWILGFRLFRLPVQIFLGLLFTGLGIILFALALNALRAAKTALSPLEPTTTIVNDGPYAYSRNPIYLAYTILYFGLVVLFDLFWGIVLFGPLIFALIHYAIMPEETYLARKFPEEYSAYKARVRRWF